MYKSSRQQTFEKAIMGTIVVKFEEKALITAVEESRGYQTNYKHKRFFYFIDKINQIAIGITNDSRKHNILDRIKQGIIEGQIINETLFKELLLR